MSGNLEDAVALTEKIQNHFGSLVDAVSYFRNVLGKPGSLPGCRDPRLRLAGRDQ
jgi:hypothetical protein